MRQTAFYRGITSKVKAYGRAVLSVFEGDDGEPCFSYTIGNAEHGLPELFVIGMIGDTATWVLNTVSKKLAEGAPMGEIDLGGKFPPYVLPASDEAKDRFTVQATRWRGNDDYQLVQVVVPDEAGRFPWNPKCAEPYRRQKIFWRLAS